MEKHWMRGRKKPKPSVIITVTGGAEDFHIESHIRDAFAKGKVAVYEALLLWLIACILFYRPSEDDDQQQCLGNDGWAVSRCYEDGWSGSEERLRR